MAIRFQCPCGATITVPDLLAGHTGRCPGCDGTLVAPAPEPASAPPPPPPPPPSGGPGPPGPQGDPPATARGEGRPFEVLRVECPCGRKVAVPRHRLEAGRARCPVCDRPLAR